jgi:hypothetical protein
VRETKLWRTLFVPKGISHQLVTHDKPVLNIIKVVGPNALSLGDYHYE